MTNNSPTRTRRIAIAAVAAVIGTTLVAAPAGASTHHPSNRARIHKLEAQVQRDRATINTLEEDVAALLATQNSIADVVRCMFFSPFPAAAPLPTDGSEPKTVQFFVGVAPDCMTPSPKPALFR